MTSTKKKIVKSKIQNFRADVSFFIEGSVEKRLPLLIASESPLKLDKKFDDFYLINPKNQELTGFFTYGVPDSETLETPLHIETQKVLNFQPEGVLSYPRCYFNPNKCVAFKEIFEYLGVNNIPHYMTLQDEEGNEKLLRGYNPITNIKIKNS